VVAEGAGLIHCEEGERITVSRGVRRQEEGDLLQLPLPTDGGGARDCEGACPGT
jgi:hypothetical protein